MSKGVAWPQDAALLAAQRDLAEALPILVMISDAEGIVEFFNHRWYDFTGQDPFERDQQEDWRRYMHPDDGAGVRAAWHDAVQRGERLVKMRYRLRHHETGEYRWFAAQAVAVEDEEGRIRRWIGTAVDVQDEIEARTALVASLDTQTAVAERYQRAALPADFPIVAGIRFDAEYRASDDALLVGGDWYDAFLLPDGRVAVSVGDVVGHGLEAAVTMTQIRQSGRAVAMWSAKHAALDPADVLDMMEQTLLADESNHMLATAIFGIIDPRARTFSYASAGHPPPLLKVASGEVRELPIGGTLLGCPGARPTHIVSLAGASALILYTDGAIEGLRNIDLGLAAMRATAQRLNMKDGENSAATLLAGACRAVGDDAAILIVHLSS